MGRPLGDPLGSLARSATASHVRYAAFLLSTRHYREKRATTDPAPLPPFPGSERRGAALTTASEATQILWALGRGDRSRADRLMELVYGELRGLARRYVGGWGAKTPLQPTELVHEAFVKLVDHEGTDWRGRSHFYAVAATAMRQILVDEARKRNRQRRGGASPISLWTRGRCCP